MQTKKLEIKITRKNRKIQELQRENFLLRTELQRLRGSGLLSRLKSYFNRRIKVLFKEIA